MGLEDIAQRERQRIDGLRREGGGSWLAPAASEGGIWRPSGLAGYEERVEAGEDAQDGMFHRASDAEFATDAGELAPRSESLFSNYDPEELAAQVRVTQLAQTGSPLAMAAEPEYLESLERAKAHNTGVFGPAAGPGFGEALADLQLAREAGAKGWLSGGASQEFEAQHRLATLTGEVLQDLDGKETVWVDGHEFNLRDLVELQRGGQDSEITATYSMFSGGFGREVPEGFDEGREEEIATLFRDLYSQGRVSAVDPGHPEVVDDGRAPGGDRRPPDQQRVLR